MKSATSNRCLFYFMFICAGFGQDTTSFELPIQIGPIVDDLPLLDTLLATVEDTILRKEKKIAVPPVKSYPLNASGTFFRGVEMSSQGTGGLSGGLRFQLAGKLSENIRVSGTVTDESIPIQPDGTTATLEELDKVYLNVSHPLGELTAGDITVINKSGKYNNNSRNIIGINNNINQNGIELGVIFGQSKGKYHRLEIKGQDGNQGPYFLSSKTGQRNVIISAGSEKVWLNGIQLKRGQDRDYTVDYTAGELTFTPKHLIFFDSDIDIEYQYSESNYKTNYLETDFKGSIGEKVDYNISYIDERDNKASSLLTADQKTVFESEDQIYQSGVVADSLGVYELIDDIFYYRPVITLGMNRYNVNFSPDQGGDYVRKISQEDRIYYEFVATDQLDNRQRYSPGRSIGPPSSQQLLHFDTNIFIRSGMSLSTEGAFSIKEKNVYSNRSETRLNGNAFQLSLKQEPISIGKINLGFGVTHWQKGSDFRPLSRDRDVDFNESWDMTVDKQENGESLSSLKSQFNVGNRIKGDVNLSRFEQGDQSKNRSEIDLNYKGSFINEAKARWNKVQSDIAFQEIEGHIRLFKGSINPFVTLIHEMRDKAYRFDDILIGIDYTKKNRSISIGFGQREDLKASFLEPSKMEKTQIGKTIQMDFNSKQSSGWRHSWMFRQRIQENNAGEIQNNFSTMRGILNFRKRTSPLQADLVLNAQNGLNESRAVVYDSIGVGLGHYRYDPLLNEYIRDKNGAYVAHTVFTGDHNSGFQMNGLSRFSLDFARWKFDRLKNIKYRFLNRLNFHGPDHRLDIVLEESDIQFYRQNMRHELIYRKKGQSNRHRLWKEDRLNFSGMDPRGWEKRLENELGGESQLSLKNEYHFILSGELHELKVSSEQNRITERTISGFATEVGFKELRTGTIQREIRLIYYKDRTGIGYTNPIDVSAYGVKTNWIHFIGKHGRIEGQIDYIIADGFNTMPPEALKGLSNARTIRTNLTASMLLGRSLSINATLLYLDDARYDGFIKLRGEVRAHF